VTGPGGLAIVAAYLCVAATFGRVMWRRPPPPRAFALLLGGLLLVATPAQSWYAVCLLATATVAAEPAWAIVVAAGYPYVVAVVLAEPYSALVGRGAMAAGLVAVVLAAARRGPTVSDVSTLIATDPTVAASESSADRKRHPVGPSRRRS
jgi:hypothetical protein